MPEKCELAGGTAAESATAFDPRARLGRAAESWWLRECDAAAPAENMAADEVLLEEAVTRGAPVLRFYSWAVPAATFGYFQNYSEIERATWLRPLIRRATGGGLVPHDADWTYSLTVPPQHAWYALSAVESYRRIHQWVADAFARLGVAVELAACCRKEMPGQCFVGAEKFDVLWQGRKIAGAAQRRNRLGLLIQGSIQPPPVKVSRAQWQRAFCALATERWAVKWEPLNYEAALRERVARLAAEKYATEEYNRKR